MSKPWLQWFEIQLGDGVRKRPELSGRALRALDHFESVEQVTVLGLYRLKHVGRKTVKEIKEVFHEHGLRVPEGEPISPPIRGAVTELDWNKIALNRWGKGMLINEVRRLRAENERLRRWMGRVDLREQTEAMIRERRELLAPPNHPEIPDSSTQAPNSSAALTGSAPSGGIPTAPEVQ